MSEKRTGRPRQRVQGGRRRSQRDAGDKVGESPLLRQFNMLDPKGIDKYLKLSDKASLMRR